MTFRGTFDDHRILRPLINFWGLGVVLNTFGWPLRTSRALRAFWGIWGHFEDQLRSWGLRILGTFCAVSWLFLDFVDLLRTFWRPEDLMLSEHWRTIQELLMTSCGPIEDLWGTLRNPRTLRTFWVIWGSFEDLRAADVGVLLCIFLISWGRVGPFADFLKTCGPEDLKTLRNFSGPFDEF